MKDTQGMHGDRETRVGEGRDITPSFKTAELTKHSEYLNNTRHHCGLDWGGGQDVTPPIFLHKTNKVQLVTSATAVVKRNK